MQEEDNRAKDKWRKASIAGWQALPDVLLKNQHKLDLSPTEMMVLINVLSYWWYADQLPYPAVSTIAKRMNVTTRTVQRSLSRLTQKKLLEKKSVETNKGEKQNVLDPEGLVKQLEIYACYDKDFLYRQEKGGKQTLKEVKDARELF